MNKTIYIRFKEEPKSAADRREELRFSMSNSYKTTIRCSNFDKNVRNRICVKLLCTHSQSTDIPIYRRKPITTNYTAQLRRDFNKLFQIKFQNTFESPVGIEKVIIETQNS